MKLFDIIPKILVTIVILHCNTIDASEMKVYDERESYAGRVLASAMGYCQPNINCLPPRRCIIIDNGPSTCQCPPPLIQDPATNACGVPSSTVRVVVYLTTIRFNSQLFNSGSPKFQSLQSQFLSTIWLIILANTDAAGFVLNVYVIRFLPGSVIVHADVVLKRGSNATADDVTRILRDGLRHPPAHSPLNLTDSGLREVYAADPCAGSRGGGGNEGGGLNLCPEPNTECRSDGLEFRECACVDGYSETVDVETGIVTCTLTCPLDYCANDGRCELKNDEKVCLCPDGYLGQRCQISHMDVLISLLTTIVLFVVAGSLIFAGINRKRNHLNQKEIDPSTSVSSVECHRSQKLN